MKPAPRDEWRWFGCAGHLIVADHCQYHLHTRIGNYRISTVGEYWPERSSREIHAGIRDPKWLAANRHRKGDDFDSAYRKRFGFETIGADRLYETFVFPVADGESKDAEPGEGHVTAWNEIDSLVANDAATARANHMKLCRKWARKQVAGTVEAKTE